jgi:hypothetical protein
MLIPGPLGPRRLAVTGGHPRIFLKAHLDFPWPESFKCRCPCYLENFYLFWNTSVTPVFNSVFVISIGSELSMRYHVTGYHVTQYHVTWYHVTRYHLTRYHVTQYHVTRYRTRNQVTLKESVTRMCQDSHGKSGENSGATKLSKGEKQDTWSPWSWRHQCWTCVTRVNKFQSTSACVMLT